MERGSRRLRMGLCPVALDDCMIFRDALSRAERKVPVEAGTQQSCPAVQGEEAAGRGQATLGWVGGQCKTSAKLRHGSQPP